MVVVVKITEKHEKHEIDSKTSSSSSICCLYGGSGRSSGSS